jgi:uncharacterized protein YndB with AHSA1/START domain
MADATLSTTGERPVLRFERHLPGSVGTVWRAVTDPDQMRAWFPTRIEIEEWKVGASLTHHFDDDDIDRYAAAFGPVLGPQDGPPEGVRDVDG